MIPGIVPGLTVREVHMERRRSGFLATVVAFVLVASVGLAGNTLAKPPVQGGGGIPITVQMTGAAEVPGPGDPDGSGVASLTLNPGLGQICYSLTVENIDPATAAHIHRAPAGVAGPVVVPLAAPSAGTSSGCVDAGGDLVREIRDNPAGFYVNVHNPAFSTGAVRGQLG
jgi:hypothetical protein